MASRQTINSASFPTIPTKYLNRNLSQWAHEAFDAVNASSHPNYNVSWTDLYAIFRNSRQLVRDANGLDASMDGEIQDDDGEIQAAIRIIREDHAYLRRVLFLVAIEKLFNCGHQNAME